MTGVVVDADVRASGPVAGSFKPFEGYAFAAGAPAPSGGAAGTERSAEPEPDDGVGEAPTTAFAIEAGAVIAATGFDPLRAAQGRVRLRAHPTGIDTV